MSSWPVPATALAFYAPLQFVFEDPRASLCATCSRAPWAFAVRSLYDEMNLAGFTEEGEAARPTGRRHRRAWRWATPWV